MLYSLGGLAKCYYRRIKCLIGPVGRDGVIRVSLLLLLRYIRRNVATL